LNNPNGPYPGRQLFVGLTPDSRPCFAYLVTGRSPESRERKAVASQNIVYMGPSGDAPYDALRHYSAVKFDSATHLLAVSNGIQTEAVYEIYRLLVNVGSFRTLDYLEKVMDGADSEPDSYHTPRIAGLVLPAENKAGMRYLLAIKCFNRPARAFEAPVLPGTLTGISTYQGSLDRPEANQPEAPLSTLTVEAKTAQTVAEFLYDISAAVYNGNDIRVCALGGVLSDSGTWEIFIRNAR